MYTVGVEAILGFKLLGSRVKIDPRIHPEWKSYKITYKHQNSTYVITVNNPNGLSMGESKISVDGIESRSDSFELVDDGQTHQIIVELVK